MYFDYEMIYEYVRLVVVWEENKNRCVLRELGAPGSARSRITEELRLECLGTWKVLPGEEAPCQDEPEQQPKHTQMETTAPAPWMQLQDSQLKNGNRNSGCWENEAETETKDKLFGFV